MLVNSFGFRAEALASAKALLQWPGLDEASCLILDVFMPDMSGFELQRRLRWIHREIPIIFITAHATEENERHALGAGAVALLKKPVADDILLAALRRALAADSLGGSRATPESNP